MTSQNVIFADNSGSSEDDTFIQWCINPDSAETPSTDETYVPFAKHRWLQWLVAIVLVFCYIGPVVYVWSKRDVAETRARSPYTTLACIMLLMLDSLFNTWIFGIDLRERDENWDDKTRKKCLLGVWVTMLIMVPILLTMYIRIYRVKRVFEVY